MNITKKERNKLTLFSIENKQLKVGIVPRLGGKIVSIFNKNISKEFLWNNENMMLKENKPGDNYDANFWGGIDELLPNDMPETIDGLSYPGHGELWTTPLQHQIEEDAISVYAQLSLSNLYYQKTLSLKKGSPSIHLKYKIRNDSDRSRHFLWKLHAALNITEGDWLQSSAQKAKIVSKESSRFTNKDEFQWPYIENTDASVIPSRGNTMDFFYLYDIIKPEMGIISNNDKHLFKYTYEKKVFPYQWYFASYGKFKNHYTAILEPATAMPISVNEAKNIGQCTMLEPGQEINTSVNIYAGINYEDS